MTADELSEKVKAARVAGFRLPSSDSSAVLASYALIRRGIVEQSKHDPWTLVPRVGQISRATFRLANAMKR